MAGGVFRQAIKSAVAVDYVMEGATRVHGGVAPRLVSWLMPGGMIVFEALAALLLMSPSCDPRLRL